MTPFRPESFVFNFPIKVTNTDIYGNMSIICLLLCMVEKLGPSREWKNIGWGCSKMGCWRIWLGL